MQAWYAFKLDVHGTKNRWIKFSFDRAEIRISIPISANGEISLQSAGHALADYFCELIVDNKEDLGMDESSETEIFFIFDGVMSTYFEHKEVSSDYGTKNIASRPVHTHEHLHLVVRAVTIIVIGRIVACKPHLTKVLVRMQSHHFSCR